ncbi:uncharacterized protein LOC111054333 isoform X1 [Nilaparvata lugens]|uniref:uncharacterized protein LOC120352430 n=1 Tax=Nilaparvata lugens TaxID=108931 RepID=UPI000B995116|nr:uncharacterized protein LOC111043641 isoform X1 [Nilaparvata lugens]XP_022184329.1 uncharacterized protein LOC111043641 isoform X1 [Nilaparvata lugens]XP_022189727.2 uncharacterized protein LOC111054333 isoform X1 [Nilaparvata lugens]XP_039288803.1 uncharacterized protein LOC120352430 [Nilaparvata lugens]XP_039299082.1 uncharacterized protein LOC111054333 isoform X1 [Nilaparvata lugens]
MKCKNIPAEFHRERVGVASSADARFTHNKIEEWIDNLDIHAYGRLYLEIVDAPPVLDLDFLSILSLKLNWFVAASTELAIIPHNQEHHHLFHLTIPYGLVIYTL